MMTVGIVNMLMMFGPHLLGERWRQSVGIEVVTYFWMGHDVTPALVPPMGWKTSVKHLINTQQSNVKGLIDMYTICILSIPSQYYSRAINRNMFKWFTIVGLICATEHLAACCFTLSGENSLTFFSLYLFVFQKRLMGEKWVPESDISNI